jgi:SAM-dependent methyltransferase
MAGKGVGQLWLESFRQPGQNPYAVGRVGRSYFTRFIRGPYIQSLLRGARLAPGARTIEVGCGSARFTNCLAVLGFRATALDISPSILANAQQLSRQAASLFGPTKTTAVLADIDRPLPIAGGAYDLVFNEGVVEHWLADDQRQRVLDDMVRITRPGGTTAVIVPNGGHPWIDHWEARNLAVRRAPPMIHYTAQRLRQDLERAGLVGVVTDGIYPWHSLDWGTTSRLRAWAGSALTWTVPVPHGLRERWGIMLVGIGHKPVAAR